MIKFKTISKITKDSEKTCRYKGICQHHISFREGCQMNIGQIKAGQVQNNKSLKEEIKTKEKESLKKDKEPVVKEVSDKEVVYEKSSVSGKEKNLEDYGKEAKVKYAADIAAVEEMKKQLDKRMENSFLQMALDVLGDQQTGLKAKLEGILKDRGDEISPEMIAQAKADVAEDGYYGVEETAKRLVNFAKALSGGNPEKAALLKDALLSGFEQAEEMWGDELPEISKQTKERALELFDEWENGSPAN